MARKAFSTVPRYYPIPRSGERNAKLSVTDSLGVKHDVEIDVPISAIQEGKPLTVKALRDFIVTNSAIGERERLRLFSTYFFGDFEDKPTLSDMNAAGDLMQRVALMRYHLVNDREITDDTLEQFGISTEITVEQSGIEPEVCEREDVWTVVKVGEYEFDSYPALYISHLEHQIKRQSLCKSELTRDTKSGRAVFRFMAVNPRSEDNREALSFAIDFLINTHIFGRYHAASSKGGELSLMPPVQDTLAGLWWYLSRLFYIMETDNNPGYRLGICQMEGCGRPYIGQDKSHKRCWCSENCRHKNTEQQKARKTQKPKGGDA